MSTFKETSAVGELSESLILIDDSITEPIPDVKCEISKSADSKPLMNTTFLGKINTEPTTSNVTNSTMRNFEQAADLKITSPGRNHSELLKRESPRPDDTLKSVISNDEVVEIDCNDTITEMEAYHNAFNQSTNSPQINSMLADSVIVIDPDDDDDDRNNVSNPNRFPG